MATVDKLAVVVAQYGADVAACVASEGVDACVELVQQAADETGAQLNTRVKECLARLVSAGHRVHSAIFVARGGFEVRDVMATAGLLRGLVASMVAVGAGHVHIRAAAGDLHTRYALTALTDAISEQLHGSGVEFHTDFVNHAGEGGAVNTEAPERETVTSQPPEREKAARSAPAAPR
jgi:hypothetical protein